jgi:multiple sugar transport system ATP-binding protein
MDSAGFELPYSGPAAAEGKPLTFGIRPEDILLEPGAPVTARVHDVENHGVEKVITLRVGETTVHATAPARTKLEMDQDVTFAWNPDRVTLFDRHTGTNLNHVR